MRLPLIARGYASRRPAPSSCPEGSGRRPAGRIRALDPAALTTGCRRGGQRRNRPPPRRPPSAPLLRHLSRPDRDHIGAAFVDLPRDHAIKIVRPDGHSRAPLRKVPVAIIVLRADAALDVVLQPVAHLLGDTSRASQSLERPAQVPGRKLLELGMSL